MSQENKRKRKKNEWKEREKEITPCKIIRRVKKELTERGKKNIKKEK